MTTLLKYHKYAVTFFLDSEGIKVTFHDDGSQRYESIKKLLKQKVMGRRTQTEEEKEE